MRKKGGKKVNQSGRMMNFLCSSEKDAVKKSEKNPGESFSSDKFIY